MTETNPAILNDGAVANNTALEPDEIEKNIRIIITKLKGKYMNEGRISMWCVLDKIELFSVTLTCHCILPVYGVFNGVWTGWCMKVF